MPINAPKVTVDRNVIISVEEQRPGYEYAAAIFSAHFNKTISIAISVANLVENQKEGAPTQTRDQLLRKCELVGLIDPILLDSPFDWEMTGWFDGVASEEVYKLEVAVFKVLFPNRVMDWDDNSSDASKKRLRNLKCDVFAMCSHILDKRDCFITNDPNLLKTKKEGLKSLGANEILTPKQFLNSSIITPIF